MSDMITKTYKLDDEKENIHGLIYGKEAMEQAIKNILYTKRYNFEIYSHNYGNEADRLLGSNIGGYKTEIERYIEDALLADERIKSVENFEIDKNEKSFEVKFDAITADGLIVMETEV